jgi:hypothetical protein
VTLLVVAVEFSKILMVSVGPLATKINKNRKRNCNPFTIETYGVVPFPGLFSAKIVEKSATTRSKSQKV